MFLTQSKRIIKTLVYLALIFSLYSLTVSTLGGEADTANYSILNTSDSGLSTLRTIIERDISSEVNRAVQTKILTSSIKSLSRISHGERALLVIMGPTIPYSFEEVISFLQFIYNNGSVLIVDDFGKANTLLDSLWQIINLGSFLMGGQGTIIKGIYFNTSAILADAASYYKTPINPVITTFSGPSDLTQGVNKIVTFAPSTLSLKIETENGTVFVPLPYGILQSSPYSWLETNTSEALKGDMSPDPWEWGGIPFSLGLAFSLGNMKVALITDPDIFSNKALSLHGFDNRQFVKNLFKWLIGDKVDTVIFDESHSAHLPTDPIYGLSLWLRFLSEISSSWYIGPFVPLILLSIIFGYLPKEIRTSTVLLSRVERVTEESPFKRRLKWYVRSKDYKSMVLLLNKYLTLLLRRKYGLMGESLSEIMRKLLIIRPDLSKYNDLINEYVTFSTAVIEGESKIKKQKQLLELLDKYAKIKELIMAS